MRKKTQTWIWMLKGSSVVKMSQMSMKMMTWKKMRWSSGSRLGRTGLWRKRSLLSVFHDWLVGCTSCFKVLSIDDCVILTSSCVTSYSDLVSSHEPHANISQSLLKTSPQKGRTVFSVFVLIVPCQQINMYWPGPPRRRAEDEKREPDPEEKSKRC